ncbi:DASH complex subunit ask1 [Termitomyces sp. T112]|nr:DASH complex subunit ask1 [Termitomyces sp. T112]
MDSRTRIPENPARWRPNPDPASIAVPGLDTSAPVLDQIEQMEQLITLKLQNIDANFAKIHHLLANKVLPALKRYAVSTEPVREAAKFWTSFYEQAAQIKIPTFDDYSTVNEESQQPEMTSTSTMQDQSLETSSSLSKSHHIESSMTSTNVSFRPGQDAFSSTPATTRMTRSYRTSLEESEDEASWNASLDPSMIRKSQFSASQQGSIVEDATILEYSKAEQGPSMHIDKPTQIPTQRESRLQPHDEKGKARDTNEPLLHNVLRHSLYPIDTSSASAISAVTSPLKYRGKPKTPVPKKFNPFLSPDKDPSQWDGIVDLTDSSAMTPQRFRKNKLTSSHQTPAREADDDSFDGLPPGMSPPVLMSPARPPRSTAELGFLKLGQTPRRDASVRITRDLVRDVQFRSGNASRDGHFHSRNESTMSTMPTPPSLSRYRRDDTSDSIVIDSSLESMMRRVGLNVPSSVSTTGSTPGLRLRSHGSLKTSELISDDPATSSPIFDEETITPVHQHEDLGMDSDSDSMDEINNTAHPSHAFLMASTGARDDSDDSFGSNHSSDSLDDEGANPDFAPVHPFAGSVENDGFDDSYDDEMFDHLHGEVQEETLFGVPPQQRMQAQQRSNPGNAGQGLRMLGEDLLQDTIAIGSQIDRIENSPTPAPSRE